jgi:hypothetical protein
MKERADPPRGIAPGSLHFDYISAEIAQDFTAAEPFFVCKI